MKTQGYDRLWSVVKLSAACVLVAAAARAGALDPQKAISQYIQTAWTTDAGLPQTSIYTVAQTGDGYLWVGTESGLARFDGVRFTVYNRHNTKALPADYIPHLLGARDGSLWIGTDSGLVHMKNGAWTTYTVHDGLSSNDIRALFEGGDGSLWVGTKRGLDRLKDGRIDIYGNRDGLPGTAVTDVKADSAGVLWIGTDAGLGRFDGKRFEAYTALGGLTSNSISALAIAPDGAVWMAGAHGQLARLAEGRLENESESGVNDSIKGDDINALLFDHDGNLWIGFESRGLARLHNGTMSFYGAQNGLPGDTVESFFEDSEHNLWAGLFDGGLVQLRDGTFTTYGKPEGLSSNTDWCGLLARDGSIWMATSTGGLDRILPNGVVRTYTSGERQSNETIHSMLETRDGTIWIGQRHGVLTRFLNGRFTTFKYQRSSKSAINSLVEDQDGSLIVGTYGSGVARFKDGKFEVLQATGEIPAMVEAADGTLWLGTDGDGVIQIKNGIATKLTKANGLLSDHILALHIDDEGVLWIGSSSGGLNRVQDGKITSYTPDQGLFDSTVGNILEDKFGNLWMGSDRGIFRVAKSELNDFASGRTSAIHGVVYDTMDGLRSRETMQGGTGTASKGPDGRLWFFTMRGLSVVDPARALGDNQPVHTQIEEVSIDGKAAGAAPTIRVGARASRLEIQFTAPSFVAPERIQFRYQLEGFDDHWSTASTRRTAEYTNLPPSHYRFLVEASRDGSEWSGDAQPMNLTVVPPWYRSRTAISSFVFAAILLTWFFVEMRTRSLKRRRDDLERLVVERTAQLEIEKQGLLRAREALQFQAAHDSLTGLWSRSAILDQLARELERATRQRTVLSVIVGDLDHFKVVNDTYGHLSGDYVLRESAHRLVGLMRGYDAVGRYGGEEFLLVLPGYDAAKNPARPHELVDVLASRPFDCNGTEINVSCSFGVTVTRPWLDHTTIDDLIRRADKALYEAKRNGRNRVEFDPTYTPAKAER
ncbi:MAG: two-component regulator propeller domain-containing protein [Terracidiphilus sp.]|jgi:diguanylate cyclase (GGDEF)-like protein